MSPIFPKAVQKDTEDFYFKCGVFKIAQRSSNTWATFVWKYFAKNFQKSTILATLNEMI